MQGRFAEVTMELFLGSGRFPPMPKAGLLWASGKLFAGRGSGSIPIHGVNIRVYDVQCDDFEF